MMIFVFYFRSLIKLIFSLIKTKTMLFQSMLLYLVLPSAPLFQHFSHLYLRKLLNQQSSLLQPLSLRSVFSFDMHRIANYLHCIELFISFILITYDYVMKQQLQSLLETLNATEPHYIRCVKPNNLLKPGIFENNNVLQQLRCGVSSMPFLTMFSGMT